MTLPDEPSGKPLCPVTGEPALRLVQWVSAAFLARLWRLEFGVDVGPSFAGTRRFGLWESPTGLYFFDPARAGDGAFYARFYANPGMRRYLMDGDRGEFRRAAAHVRPGDRVLDVGCGLGGFRAAIPAARYTGLDPHIADPTAPWARAETLADHIVDHAGHYDVVTAFQVLEHVEDPLALLAEMAEAVRPGGTVIVGVPHVPSAQTRIPNCLNNAVPHHLTWWTAPALAAAAGRVGLMDARVEASPWSRTDRFVYWMARASFVRCRTTFYRHAWTWHVSAALAALAALAVYRFLPVPAAADREGVALLLVARKPEIAP